MGVAAFVLHEDQDFQNRVYVDLSQERGKINVLRNLDWNDSVFGAFSFFYFMRLDQQIHDLIMLWLSKASLNIVTHNYSCNKPILFIQGKSHPLNAISEKLVEQPFILPKHLAVPFKTLQKWSKKFILTLLL